MGQKNSKYSIIKAAHTNRYTPAHRATFQRKGSLFMEMQLIDGDSFIAERNFKSVNSKEPKLVIFGFETYQFHWNFLQCHSTLIKDADIRETNPS